MINTYSLYYIFVMSLTIYGIFIYVKKKEQFNMREVMELFIIFCLLKIFDFTSTIYFTNKLGIEYEANILARFLMHMFGNYIGLIVALAIITPMVFFLFVTINCLSKDGISWKIFKIIIILMSIFVPIYNYLA